MVPSETFEVPDGCEERETQTVVRFYDENETQITELVDPAIPIPSEGDVVKLGELQMKDGPSNPDVVDKRNSEAEWGGEEATREVKQAVYRYNMHQYPDRVGNAVYQLVVSVEVYLKDIYE